MKRSAVIIIHIAYWCLYLVILSAFALIIKTDKPYGLLLGFGMVRFMIAIAIIPALLTFYTSYRFLFVEYLDKKRISYLFSASFATACIYGLFGIIILPFVFGSRLDPSGPSIMRNDGHNIIQSMLIPLNALINGVAGLVMKGFITWYDDLIQKEEREKKNFQMELALVRSQFSPHFLFNTINNIDVLIEKDPARASAYLNKLSDIMRFMLYETRTESIALEQELAYIDKYIELQKIRTANPDYVHYELIGTLTGQSVAPMLFIPFIENAFKHAEHKKKENAINIRILVNSSVLTFFCENSYTAAAQVRPDYGGLGNELIRKRLQLLYPGKHVLEVTDDNNSYKVKLILYPHAN